MNEEFFARPVLEVARGLIGCTLSHQDAAGVIVETEAYHQSEPACHAFRGKTPRAEMLFAAPGTAYVYFSYGAHALINAVAEPEGVGAAVLIRALVPAAGVVGMSERRGGRSGRELCSGPGKLTQALGIGLGLNGSSLLDGPARIAEPEVSERPYRIVATPRIGISAATELPWRFHAADVEHVSRPRS